MGHPKALRSGHPPGSVLTWVSVLLLVFVSANQKVSATQIIDSFAFNSCYIAKNDVPTANKTPNLELNRAYQYSSQTSCGECIVQTSEGNSKLLIGSNGHRYFIYWLARLGLLLLDSHNQAVSKSLCPSAPEILNDHRNARIWLQRLLRVSESHIVLRNRKDKSLNVNVGHFSKTQGPIRNVGLLPNSSQGANGDDYSADSDNAQNGIREIFRCK
jgi:hypothetical protein